MLVAVANRGVLAELFVWLVIGVKTVLTTGIKPGLACLDTEMVVSLTRKLTAPIGTFEDSLGESHGCWNAIFALLLDGVLRILFYILL